MITRFFAILILLIMVSGCKSSQIDPMAVDNIQALVDNRNFRIESDAAYPRATFAMTQVSNAGLLGVGNNVNRISLIGNPNFLKIEGDSVSSHLPYFGERQISGPYNARDLGIQLKGQMDDYQELWNEKHRRHELTFRARDENEWFDVTIYIFPGKTANMILSGSKRFPIEYRGTIKSIASADTDEYN